MVPYGDIKENRLMDTPRESKLKDPEVGAYSDLEASGEWERRGRTYGDVIVWEEEHVALWVIVQDRAVLVDDILIVKRLHQLRPALKHAMIMLWLVAGEGGGRGRAGRERAGRKEREGRKERDRKRGKGKGGREKIHLWFLLMTFP
jgi:hypothetical protein